MVPPTEDHSRYDSVDDDELEDAVEGGNSIEGARIDSHHIYDVYRPSYGPHYRREGQFLPSPWSSENADAERSSLELVVAQSGGSFTRHLPYGLGRRPTINRDSTSATSLTRQPSIRRPRNRATDFNEFASRRRSAQRNSAMHSPEIPEPYTAWFLPRRSPSREEPVIPVPPPENMYDSSESEPSRVRSTLFEPPEPETETSRNVQADTPDVTENPWRDIAPPAPSSLISLSRNLRGESQGFPRLRRGGLRPPESLLGGESMEAARAMASFADLPRALSSFERDFGGYFPDDATASANESGLNRQEREEATNLPTPRSISPSPEVSHNSNLQVSILRSISLSPPPPLPSTSAERED